MYSVLSHALNTQRKCVIKFKTAVYVLQIKATQQPAFEAAQGFTKRQTHHLHAFIYASAQSYVFNGLSLQDDIL